MSRFLNFCRREAVFSISFLAALASCFFVPPDGAYLGYVDFRTLALLYCLMVVVSAFRGAGAFTALAHALCDRVHTVRGLGTVLVALCFFSSMLITNDVALLTFVPFAISVLGMAGERKHVALVVVLQTVAANLGSMLTPVGNPQNLYLYSFYSFSAADFFKLTLPVWLLSLLLLALCCLRLPAAGSAVFLGEEPGMHKKELPLYVALFLLCLLTVFRVLPWPLMLAGVLAALFFFRRSLLRQADFMLLLTFVCFFVFAGNLARIPSVASFLRSAMAGREFLLSLLCSQVISNVPAAVLLSGFTENGRALLLGVDVGGLGTCVASLASLIGLKLYSRAEDAAPGRFLLLFTAVNVLFLVPLSALSLWLQ